MDDLYEAVGFVTVWWALLEQCLDMSIAIIFHKCGGNAIAAAIPVSLDNKNEFLRESFKRLPALSSHKESGLALLHDIMNFKEFRHDLTHGALAEIEASSGTFLLRRIRYDATLHRVTNAQLKIRDFPKKAKQLRVLAVRAARLSLELKDAHLQPAPTQQRQD